MATAFVPSDCFSLLLFSTDTIYVADAPPNIIEFIRNFILENWIAGLQQHTEEYGCSHRFKLFTNPFTARANAETKLVTNRFMRLLVEELSRKNWHLVLSSSKAFKFEDPKCPGEIHVVWLFRYIVSEASKEDLVCLSLAMSDRLQLVNGKEMLNEIVRSAIEMWIQKEEKFDDDFSYKIEGNPWESTDFSETIRSSKILMEIFKKFHKLGYRLKYQGNICSLNNCFYYQKERLNNTDEELELMVLAFVGADRIRIVHLPRVGNITEKVHECIRCCWKKGIQDTKFPPDSSDCVEFKLKGNPWKTDSDHQSYECRQLISKLLEMLLGCGWAVFREFDMISPRCGFLGANVIIVLQKCQPVQMPHLCLHFWEKGTIRILDVTKEVAKVVSETVQIHWAHGIQFEGKTADGTIDVIQMVGTPWKIDKEHMVLSAKLLGALLERLNAKGWSVVGSLELPISGGMAMKHYGRQNWFMVFTGNEEKASCRSVDEAPPSYAEVMAIEKKNDL